MTGLQHVAPLQDLPEGGGDLCGHKRNRQHAPADAGRWKL